MAHLAKGLCFYYYSYFLRPDPAEVEEAEFGQEARAGGAALCSTPPRVRGRGATTTDCHCHWHGRSSKLKGEPQPELRDSKFVVSFKMRARGMGPGLWALGSGQRGGGTPGRCGAAGRL